MVRQEVLTDKVWSRSLASINFLQCERFNLFFALLLNCNRKVELPIGLADDFCVQILVDVRWHLDILAPRFMLDFFVL